MLRKKKQLSEGHKSKTVKIARNCEACCEVSSCLRARQLCFTFATTPPCFWRPLRAVCLLVCDSVWHSCMTDNEQNTERIERNKEGEVNPAGHIVAQQFCWVVALPRTGCISSPSHSNLMTPVSPLLILFSLYWEVTESSVCSLNFLTFRPPQPN